MRVVPSAYKIMLSRYGAHTKTVCFSPCRRTNEFRNHILLCGELTILLCARFKRLPLSYRGDRVVFKRIRAYIYSVFGRHGALLLLIVSVFYKQTDTVSCMVATSRLYVTVSYGSCMVAASDLYSTVSYGRAVQTPSAVDDVRDGCNCTHKLCSAIRWVLYNLSSVVLSIWEKIHLLWDIKIRS